MELMRHFLNGDYRVTQRAAWPLSYCAMAHPELMKTHLLSLLKHLRKPQLHHAVKRNAVRLLQFVDIPEKYEGAVMEICFNFLAASSEPVAVKAYSMKVLEQLSKKYPEILPEIKYLVLEQLPHQSAAFRSSARAFLKD